MNIIPSMRSPARSHSGRLQKSLRTPVLSHCCRRHEVTAVDGVNSLPLPALLAIFAVAGGAVWLAGNKLSAATDVLETRLGLGEALGGLILLAIVTNLPEIGRASCRERV